MHCKEKWMSCRLVQSNQLCGISFFLRLVLYEDFQKKPRVYLDDILESISKIEEYVKEGKDSFFHDGKTQDAVIYQIAIIGEASAKLPISLKKSYSEIPWRKIIAMRNIVIHDYSETDLPIVWAIVKRDLPVLEKAVKDIVKEIES